MSLVTLKEDETSICEYEQFSEQTMDQHQQHNGNGNGVIDCVKIESSKEIIVGTSNNFHNSPVTFKVDNMKLDAKKSKWELVRENLHYLMLAVVSIGALITISIVLAMTVGKTDDNNGTVEDEWKFVTRTDWNASKSNFPILNDLKIPIQRIIVAKTATEGCSDNEECVKVVKRIQEMDKIEHKDIIFNFLIGGNGFVYEGRGWEKSGEHTSNESVSFNEIGICVAFIGTDSLENHFKSLYKLISEGIKQRNVSSDYYILPQNELLSSSETNLPQAYYKEIRKMNNYKNLTLANDMFQLYNDSVAKINFAKIPNYPTPPQMVFVTQFVFDSCDKVKNMEFIKEYFVKEGHDIYKYANFWIVLNNLYLGRGWDKVGDKDEDNGEFYASSIRIVAIVIQDKVNLMMNITDFVEEGVFLGKIHKEYRIFLEPVNSTTTVPGPEF